MAQFKNRVRLPFYITRPQYPSERDIFRKADGTTKVMSVVIRRVFEGETDYLPDDLHRKLIIALSHDQVNLESDRYFGGVAIDADYEIDWQRFLDYPVAKASFKVQVTPFAATNSNCKSCVTMQQLDLENDIFPDDLEEGETYDLNLSTNDSICCYPATFTITYFDTLYIQTAVVDPVTGVLTITMKDPIGSQPGAYLVGYKVTCEDGSYDEAFVYGNVVGSITTCLAPFDIVASNTTETETDIDWSVSPSSPADGYYWELFDSTNLGTPVQTGSIPSFATSLIHLTGLTPGHSYIFLIQSLCEEGVSESVFNQTNFDTQQPASLCGKFILTNNDPGGPVPVVSISYKDCNGDTVERALRFSAIICALTNPDNSPVLIHSTNGGDWDYEYVEPC